MAILINGDGNEAVYAAQDADWYASIMGNVTAITGVGQQFESNLEDANTISVSDGVIITKEGRRIQLDTDEVDVFGIPTGTQDSTNYYIIGYELSIDDNSNQICNTFVEKMDSVSATIPEETFKGGATSVMVSLYRVTQEAMAITSIDLLLPKITDIKSISESISQINSDLSAINERLNNNIFGTSHDLTAHTSISNAYTFSYDGYVEIIMGGGVAGEFVRATIVGKNNNVITRMQSTTFLSGYSGDYACVFVKKGMKAFVGISGTTSHASAVYRGIVN